MMPTYGPPADEKKHDRLKEVYPPVATSFFSLHNLELINNGLGAVYG